MDKFFGFRVKGACHNVFKSNKIQLKEYYLDYINIDLEKYFDKGNHDWLLEVFNVIVDQAIIELLCKFLKIGYVDIYNLAYRANYNTEGTL